MMNQMTNKYDLHVYLKPCKADDIYGTRNLTGMYVNKYYTSLITKMRIKSVNILIKLQNI
jgi:hypothetical protein